MSKVNCWFFGFFLAMLWPSVSMLCAEEPPPLAAVSSQEVVPPASEEVTPGVDSAVQMAQEEVRDPFAGEDVEGSAPALAAAAAPAIKVELQGIGFGSKDAYAVIGGEVFYDGDEKQGIKLLEVRRREVGILVNGGKTTVSLFPDEDLKKAKDRAKKKSDMKNTSMDQPSETPSSLSGREQPPL